MKNIIITNTSDTRITAMLFDLTLHTNRSSMTGFTDATVILYCNSMKAEMKCIEADKAENKRGFKLLCLQRV